MAQWSSSYITALPDSAFACIDSKGRHYPHHNAAGKLDLAHLRNAMSRLGQDDTTSCGAAHLRAHAKAEGMGQKAVHMEAMKAEQLGTAKWRVLAIPFGGPLKGGKDLDYEYFSPRTDTKPHWFNERPVLFHHGKDSVIGDEDVGVEDELIKENDGWWARMWLDRQSRYFAQLDALIRAGKAFGSSGTMGHLVKRAPDGELRVWPHVEQTFTLTPINILSRITPSKALDDFTSAGIALPPEWSALAELDSTTDLDLDLPTGGEDPARARLLALANAQLARLKNL